MRHGFKVEMAFLVLFLHLFVGECFSQSGRTVKIAVVFSKTGIASMEGVACFEAVRFAVDKVNADGGVLGRKIVVSEIDNKSMPVGAKQAAVEAVNEDVVAVVGASWSSHSLAMAPIFQEAGIPMVSPTSTNPKLTLAGDYIFRVCFTDPFQGKVMSEFAQRRLHAKTAVIIRDISSDYSVGLANFFKIHFSDSGMTVLSEVDYMGADISIDEALESILVLKPDVIFIPGHEKDSASVMSKCREKGIESVFLGADGWSARMYKLSDGIEGSYFSTYWHRSVPFSKSKLFLEDYKRRFNKEVIPEIALVYDAVMVLCDAIKRAGSVDRSKIRDAIASTTGFDGVTGQITIGKNGDPVNKDAVILKFEGKKSIFITTIKPE